MPPPPPRDPPSAPATSAPTPETLDIRTMYDDLGVAPKVGKPTVPSAKTISPDTSKDVSGAPERPSSPRGSVFSSAPSSLRKQATGSPKTISLPTAPKKEPGRPRWGRRIVMSIIVISVVIGAGWAAWTYIPPFFIGGGDTADVARVLPETTLAYIQIDSGATNMAERLSSVLEESLILDGPLVPPFVVAWVSDDPSVGPLLLRPEVGSESGSVEDWRVEGSSAALALLPGGDNTSRLNGVAWYRSAPFSRSENSQGEMMIARTAFPSLFGSLFPVMASGRDGGIRLNLEERGERIRLTGTTMRGSENSEAGDVQSILQRVPIGIRIADRDAILDTLFK